LSEDPDTPRSRSGSHRRDAREASNNKHPLYRFLNDKKPGAVAGEGSKAFGAEWYVVGTNGKKIEKEGS
jgi:Secreted repeat of unknown function